MKNSYKILLIVFLLVGVSASAIYFVIWNSYSKDHKLAENSKPMVQEKVVKNENYKQEEIVVEDLQGEEEEKIELKTFRDEELGIEFQYPEEEWGQKMLVERIDDAVYLHNENQEYNQGQFLRVFQKNEDDTLKEAIENEILREYPKEECFVNDFDMRKNYYFPDNYVTRTAVDFPRDENAESMEEILKSDCPYRISNGVRYFLADKNNYDQFVFLSIGQYEIRVSKDVSWHQTIKFLRRKNEINTSEWKLYKNNGFGIETIYPSHWFSEEKDDLVYFVSPERKKKLEGDVPVRIFDIRISNYKSLSQHKEKKHINDRELDLLKIVTSNSFVKEADVFIGGISGFRGYYKEAMGSNDFIYLTKASGEIYEIELNMIGEPEEDYSISEKIAFSLKMFEKD